MKEIHIERLPDKATAKTIKQMIETDKYNWREQGLTKKEVKDRVQIKLANAYVSTNESLYLHAYKLLINIRQ